MSRGTASSTHETFAIAMQRPDIIRYLTSNAPMFLYFGRQRFSATDATTYGVTEGNDGLRLAVWDGRFSPDHVSLLHEGPVA